MQRLKEINPKMEKLRLTSSEYIHECVYVTLSSKLRIFNALTTFSIQNKSKNEENLIFNNYI